MDGRADRLHQPVPGPRRRGSHVREVVHRRRRADRQWEATTALFAAYINDNESELRIVHAFPDAEAMSSHFEGSDERASSIAEIVQPAGYEVFGPAPALAVDQLEREATASGVELKVYRDWVGGFLRAPA